MERYSIKGEDMKRYYILKKVIDGLITLRGSPFSSDGFIPAQMD